MDMKFALDLTPIFEDEEKFSRFMSLLGAFKCPGCGKWATKQAQEWFAQHKERLLIILPGTCCRAEAERRWAE